VILTPLLDELASLDSPVVLVLDDFHLIDASSIFRSLIFLLDHLPPHMHLVIATRADPRLPIANLRAKGELVELREVDLRFTEGEISLFLERALGLDLSQEQIEKLASRTEGWIAGLQLAAISMIGRKDLRAFIEEFSGSHEYIVDYLTDEVLKSQSDEVQIFLLETSILDSMCAPLCEAVTGQTNAMATLDKLRDAHLFIVPLDDERRWFRYHRLFADHLQKRLQKLYPEKVNNLHRAAGKWFEQAGMLSEAIDHAIQAEDFDRTADLIDQITEEIMMRSEFALYLRWTDALPAPVLNQHPMLGIAKAISLLMTGNPVNEVEHTLDGLVLETEVHLGGKYVAQAIIAVLLGQLSKANQLARQAINLLSGEENKNLRHVTNWIISYTTALESKPSEGLRTLEKVVKEGRASGNEALVAVASIEIAKLFTYQGKLRKAKEVLQEVLDFARDERGNPLPIAGDSLIELGDLFREENHFEEAEKSLIEGIDLSKWGRTATSHRGYLSLAKLRFAQGDVADAYRYFKEAKAQAFFEFNQLYVAVTEAKYRVSRGDLNAAEEWQEERDRIVDPQSLKEKDNAINKHIRKYEDLLRIRILLSQNQYQEALKDLETLLQEMEQLERLDIIIEIHILKALILQEQEQSAEALAALESALTLAKPRGYVRIFLDEGEPMARLLNEASIRRIHAEYTGQLLAASSKGKLERQSISQSSPLPPEIVNPLSERELQVLRLLASPLTSTEIAGELYISVNTARFHIKNIYANLGAHSRTEALDRAKELGLLP
jgi:LuxR family maltose regulon positive regulatory protein